MCIRDSFKDFTLPDGHTIGIGNQLIRTPELLFNPKLDGNDKLLGIHELIRECVTRCDVEVRKELYPVSYTHLRAHETVLDLVCRLLLEKKKKYFTSRHMCD
eukprot:TRINITY_DN22557_c0_g1_i1.p1 TRINITY_DN22557_c0_g1~~TRINITY_DN22557_c0_g1_i1.p1  ORF type:complete len:102 (-),score=53.32 TRINITY_DN22557_c0_g1_i1:68-373(-)